MKLNQTVHRESLNTAEGTQLPCMPALFEGVAEHKSTRYTWAFNPTQGQIHERAGEDCERLEDESRLKHDSSVFLQQHPVSRTSSLNAKHMATFKNTQTRRSDLKRRHSLQSGNLAPIMEKKHVEISTVMQNRVAVPKVMRWDGRTRTTSVWDSLRRDSELFSQRGNCSIHLYEKGQSRRGPSFRVPLERIYSARFASLFTLFHTEFSCHDDIDQDIMHRQCDLYISAPESSRRDAFNWHVTTRNFVAFVLGRPVVGAVLSQALISLKERLELFRPNDPRNHEDYMAYLEKAGYLELAHCPDYALALLVVSEHLQVRDIWVDAFAHCVGMNDVLRAHPELKYVSRVTHALITRAYLEMDLHLGRVTRTLSNFLEDDFSSANFGASAGTRLHLDRFRNFLNEYYVAKFGYWPPPKRANFSKSLYKSMYFDFRSLYDYLVDLDSTSSLVDQKPASGGICVLQNVKAFDERHRMIPLPHPHPLLPRDMSPLRRSSGSQTALVRSFMLGTRHDSAAELAMARDALTLASNSQDASITASPLVKAYQRFEAASMQRSEERISPADARKVRWLVVYATLQMLISVTRAPKEVRMTDTTYPLCCLVTGTPPWLAGTKALKSVHTPSVLGQTQSTKHVDMVPMANSIHPDCEFDDYISRRASSMLISSTDRRASTLSSWTDDSPAHVSKVGLLRNASIRSVKTFSSSIGSLSRRSSSRRNSTPAVLHLAQQLPLPLVKPHTALGSAKSTMIVVHGYGNGLSDSIYSETSRFVPIEMSSEILPEIVISTNTPPHNQAMRSSSAPDVRPRSAKRNDRPVHLVLNSQSSIIESQRTPLMNGFDCALPGLLETDNVSSSESLNGDDSSPPALSWTSSRSNSPSQHDSPVDTTEPDLHLRSELPSPVSPSFSESTFSTLSPISPVTTSLPILSSKKSMDLPMVVDIEEMAVYQPTGVPSVDTIHVVEEDEFPDRERSKRWSVATKSHSVAIPLKSSLRRAHTVTNVVAMKRSVKIKV